MVLLVQVWEKPMRSLKRSEKVRSRQKKNMTQVAVVNRTIPYEVIGHYGAVRSF